mgnify:CR=1 FL=1
MKRNSTHHISRRQVLTALGASAGIGMAGCIETDNNTSPDDSTGLPTREQGIKEWGQKLNEHARKANIDWQMFEDEGIELKFGMGLHKYSTTTKPLIPYFEDLTGISVEYDIFEEDRYWREAENAMSAADGEYDGFMVGLWPAGGYHQGTDGDPWVEDLWPYINNATLTDKDWLAMDDFMDQTIELMTFPDPDGGESFVGFPNGIEIYGCVGYDMETYETLGLEEPETFEELEQNAKAISESNEVNQEGMVSRTASATLSSANWGTMFRSHGAKWIDREVLLNEDDPDPEAVALINSDRGVESLERFGSILHNYGPSQAWTKDWYANNQTYNRGDVGMIYTVLLVMAGSLMISYTRARAEGLDVECDVGLMQRPERVVLIGAAALFFGEQGQGVVLKGVLILLAVLTNFTAAQRIYWVWKQTRPDGEPSPAGSTSAESDGRTGRQAPAPVGDPGGADSESDH